MKIATRFLALAALLLCRCTHSALAPNQETVTPNSNQAAPTNSTTQWRDQEVTTGWFTRGEINLRHGFNPGVGNGYTPNSQGLFFNVGVAGAVRIGIDSGGTRYSTYVQDNPASCITNWPSSGSHNFTFGVVGFTVYLKIDGVVATDTCQTNPSVGNLSGALQYYEYRPGCCDAGSPAIWIQGGGNGTATFTYFPYQFLYSSVSGTSVNGVANGTMIFDPRDFGMRAVTPVTGSISAGSSTLTLNSPADFRVGDSVIVEVGGEAGGGLPGTDGVGGNSPILHYANTMAMNADTSQADGTQAYIDTDHRVWRWSSGSTTWTEVPAPCGLGFGSCATASGGTAYFYLQQPQSLVAWVTAVDASPATALTLGANAHVATTNANVYLDVSRSFYPLAIEPSGWFANRDDGLIGANSMTISIPAGDWYTAGGMGQSLTAIGSGFRNNITIFGQGPTSTVFHAPKGTPMGLLNTGTQNNGVMRDFGYIGNACDTCAMYGFTGANHNLTFWPGAIGGGSGGTQSITAQNINCTNVFGCVSIFAVVGTLDNINVTNTNVIRGYSGWMVQIFGCGGGSQIKNSTVTGTYLTKGFELFSCSNAKIVHSAGQNVLYSSNSSTNWTIDFNRTDGTYDGLTDTITANSWADSSTDPDEGVINVNDNAFGSGSIGLINNARILQQGYIDSASLHGRSGYNNSLKMVDGQIPQDNLTIQGQYPGAGGCHTDLGGYFKGPDYDPVNSGEYGITVRSLTKNNVISGIRVVGAARGTLLNFTLGNIGVPDATGTVTNNVADIIQSGPTQSGNQTNAAYGGC
jgi:hypothetical protein